MRQAIRDLIYRLFVIQNNYQPSLELFRSEITKLDEITKEGLVNTLELMIIELKDK